MNGPTASASAATTQKKAGGPAKTADPEEQQPPKETPLHLACATHQPAMVKILLTAQADPSAYDETGKTPLHRCFEGKVTVDVPDFEAFFAQEDKNSPQTETFNAFAGVVRSKPGGIEHATGLLTKPSVRERQTPFQLACRSAVPARSRSSTSGMKS